MNPTSDICMAGGYTWVVFNEWELFFMRKLVLILVLMSSYAFPAPIDVFEFETEQDRSRYQRLVNELRCPKCQNQNLIDSNSQIAIDLRSEVAHMVMDGKTDAEIINFMVNRYGDFVLYRPSVQNNTYLLWVGPALMFGLALLIFAGIIIRKTRQTSTNN